MSEERAVPLCPSSRCQSGHLLLGIIDAGGRVRFMPDRFAVDEHFVRVARQGRPPEQRFRFSSPCLTSGCEKWEGDGCRVARILRQQAPALLSALPPADPPACSIRSQCRWHMESGDAICHACEWVITNRQSASE